MSLRGYDGKSFFAFSPGKLSMQSRARYRLFSWLACVFVLLWANTATAATLEGVVVKITDGDTVTVLDSSKTQFKVRLAGVDAPESKQAFGHRSRQYLASIVFQKQVTVEWAKVDKFKRIVGKILVDGNDVNLRLVQAGFAWHYKAYAKEQSLSDAALYAEAEREAREKRIGLWTDTNPVAPWEWRRARKGAPK
jgi:endonuclease YncB( thermonuclease family)